jgi:hypothetical protein
VGGAPGRGFHASHTQTGLREGDESSTTTYRLGALAHEADVSRAIQLLVSGAGFLGFLQRTTTRLGLAQYRPGEHTPRAFALRPTRTTPLSATTRGKIQRYEQLWEIDAVRTAEHEITGKSLWLAAYDVDGRRAIAPSRPDHGAPK